MSHVVQLKLYVARKKSIASCDFNRSNNASLIKFVVSFASRLNVKFLDYNWLLNNRVFALE